MDKTLKKVVYLFLFTLLIMVFIAPVQSAEFVDPNRCDLGASPEDYFLTNDTSKGYTNAGFCSVTTGSSYIGLHLSGLACTNYLPELNEEFTYANMTIKNPSDVWIHTAGLNSATDNGNGSSYYSDVYGGDITPIYATTDPLCNIGNYVSGIGYRDYGAYTGDYYIVPYFTFRIEEEGYNPFTGDFEGIPTSGDNPLTVTFTDKSGDTPILNYWDYGDGYTFSNGNYNSPVQHTYTTSGWFDVKYFAWLEDDSQGWVNKTSYIEVLSVINQTTGGYSFSVSPSSVNYNENFTLTLSSQTGNFTDIKEVRFGWTQGTNSDILYDNDGYILDYTLNGGNWYQYDGSAFSINKGSAFPSPITLIPADFGSGLFTMDAYLIKTNNQVIHLTGSLTITTTNQQTLTIQAIDFNDAYLVSTAHINVLDIASNIWDNKSAGGEKIFYYPYNQKLFIEVNSTSYYTSTKNYTVTASPTNTVQVVMYRGINTPVGNVTLRVNVMDNHGGYLNNAKVTVLNDESYFDSQSKYTNYAGIATFTVLPTTDYAISVSKTGYLSAGKLINSGTGGLTYDTTIVLNEGTNPTATPTPLPTTAQGGYTGNLGGTNITPVSCQTTLPKGATLLDTLRNNMACAGIQSGQNQGYGIALLIIFTLGIIGGKYGKGMGVVMGMSSGYVLSLAMGLVPLWTFIAMIIFICLILAIKLWSSDK